MTSRQPTDGALPCANAVNIEVSHNFLVILSRYVEADIIAVHTCVDAVEPVMMNKRVSRCFRQVEEDYCVNLRTVAWH